MRGAQPIDLSHGPVALGRYVLLSTLGRGGMSVVYSAYDEALDRKVAIKVLRAPDQLARLRLRREAQALAQLAHPNVVRVYEIGELDELDYIVMELVDGVTLQVWTEQQPRSLDEILAVYRAAGRGLAAAHAKGIVHRDFKPENAMIRADGQVLVMDFGLARDGRDEPEGFDVELDPELGSEVDLDEAAPTEPSHSTSRSAPELESGSVAVGGRSRSSVQALTRFGAVMGTVGYMAPEQVLGQVADTRGDQFSFCVSVWEAVHGQRPFPALDFASYRAAVLDERPRTPTSDAAPPWLRAVLERGLARDPADRWPSMSALLDALARDPRRSRRRWLAGVGTLALVGVVAAGFWGADRRARAEQIAACETEQVDSAARWTPERAAGLEQRLLATGDPLASSAWAATRPWLDRYAERLAQLRGDNCRATHVDRTRSPEDAARVEGCLDDSEARFEALLAILHEASPGVVEHAAEAAAALPPLGDCDDPREQARLLRPPAPLIEDLQPVQRRLYRVEALRRTGDPGKARAEAELALAEAEALGWPPAIGEALLLLAGLAEAQDDRDTAIAAVERAFRVAAIAGDSVGMLAAAVRRVGLASGQNQFELADAWRETAEALLADTGLDRGPLAGELARIRADIERARGDAAASEREALRAVAIAEANFGPDHPSLAAPLTTLAHALDMQDRRAQSRAHYERILAIMLRAYGPDHPALIEIYNNLGGSHHVAQDIDGARDYYLRALAVQERTYGLGHSQAAWMLCNLGLIAYEVDGELELAQDYFERGAAVIEAHHDPNHLVLLKPLVNLGSIASRLGQHEDALAYFDRAVTILTAVSDSETDAREIWVWASYADAYLRKGDYAAAVPGYQRALAAAERIHGPDHGQVVRPLLGLAECQVGLGQLDLARASLARVALLIDQQPGRKWLFELIGHQLAWADGERDEALRAVLALRADRVEQGAKYSVIDLDRWLASVGHGSAVAPSGE